MFLTFDVKDAIITLAAMSFGPVSGVVISGLVAFIEFISILKKYDNDVDIMIEAKAKDEAMFKLIRELKYKTNYEFMDETSFKI